MPRQRTEVPEAPTPAKRITLSQVVEALLQRSPRDHSSVTLTRNSKGDTQIEVVVRTGEDADCATPADALNRAIELYDTARKRYPMVSPPPAAGKP